MLKGLLKMIVVCNILFAPLYFIFLISLTKKKVNINDYELKKVKITSLYYDNDDGGIDVVIDYKIIKDTAKIGAISFSDKSENYSHFSNLMKRGIAWEVFESKTSPKVGDSIWVWHNDNAGDFYAFGEKDSFNRIEKNINRDFNLLVILILLALISIYKLSNIMRYLT